MHRVWLPPRLNPTRDVWETVAHAPRPSCPGVRSQGFTTISRPSLRKGCSGRAHPLAHPVSPGLWLCKGPGAKKQMQQRMPPLGKVRGAGRLPRQRAAFTTLCVFSSPPGVNSCGTRFKLIHLFIQRNFPKHLFLLGWARKIQVQEI